MVKPPQLAVTDNDKIYVGSKPKFTASFYDSSDVLTDPTTVTFELTTPSGDYTAYVNGTDSEVANPSTGVYTFRILLSEGGQYSLRAVTDTTFGAAINVVFDVVHY